jgi:PleD family two-component response regulator
VANAEEWSTRSIESVIAANGFDVLRAQTAREVRGHLVSTPVDVLLLNVNLPDASGIALCRDLRERLFITASTPVVMLSPALTSRAMLLDALRAGAWDLISLPFDPDVLLAKLAIFAHAKIDADEARDSSLVDDLSGLYNIRGVLRRAVELGNEASRLNTALACVVFGAELAEQTPAPEEPRHLPRQETMRMADRFRQATRGSDAVGRLAETEFVVLAPHTGRAGALRMAERLADLVGLDLVNQSDLPEKPTAQVKAGCYAVADFRSSDIAPSDLVVRATMALRRSQTDTAGSPIRFYGENEGTATA